jgi:hypothetical protein
VVQFHRAASDGDVLDGKETYPIASGENPGSQDPIAADPDNC